MQSCEPGTIENLYRANEVFAKRGDAQKAARRPDYQHRTLTELKLLGYIAQPAMERKNTCYR